MEITLDRIYQQLLDTEARLKTGLKAEVDRLDDKIMRLDRKVDESRIRTTQWVIGIFIGTVVVISALGSVYLSGMLLLAR